jgi:hypothetical protein
MWRKSKKGKNRENAILGLFNRFFTMRERAVPRQMAEVVPKDQGLGQINQAHRARCSFAEIINSMTLYLFQYSIQGFVYLLLFDADTFLVSVYETGCLEMCSMERVNTTIYVVFGSQVAMGFDLAIDFLLRKKWARGEMKRQKNVPERLVGISNEPFELLLKFPFASVTASLLSISLTSLLIFLDVLLHAGSWSFLTTNLFSVQLLAAYK